MGASLHKPAPAKKPAAKLHKYTIYTGPALSPGVSPAGMGGGGIIGSAFVQKADKPDVEAVYMIAGAGVNGGLSVGLLQLYSSPNDFESHCTGIEMFSGKVSVGEWSAGVLISYGQSSWRWLDPPAAPTVCTGDGLSAGIVAGVTCGTSLLTLTFLKIRATQPPEKVARSADALDRARKF